MKEVIIMDRATLNKILDIQDHALADPVYQELHAQYTSCSDGFLDLLARLPEPERTVLEDYLGVSAAMHLRLLELAVR